MPTISIDPKVFAPQLRKAVSTLKAALVVSAAAILSQGKADLEANAATAFGHFDDFLIQIDAICDDALTDEGARRSGSSASLRNIDSQLLELLTDVVDGRTGTVEQALKAITGSSDRSGLDDLSVAIGELGNALTDLMAIFAPPSDENVRPFRYDQFFLQAMQELGERDWSAS